MAQISMCPLDTQITLRKESIITSKKFERSRAGDQDKQDEPAFLRFPETNMIFRLQDRMQL